MIFALRVFGKTSSALRQKLRFGCDKLGNLYSFGAAQVKTVFDDPCAHYECGFEADSVGPIVRTPKMVIFGAYWLHVGCAFASCFASGLPNFRGNFWKHKIQSTA